MPPNKIWGIIKSNCPSVCSFVRPFVRPFKLCPHLGAYVTFCDPILVISILPFASPNPMFEHLLASSHHDDSNKWSNKGFREEITQVVLIEVNFTHIIRGSGSCVLASSRY